MKYIIIVIILINNVIIWGNPNFFDDSKLNDKDLNKAIDLYEGLDFTKSEKLFKKIIKESKNRLEKAIAYKYLAFTYTLKQKYDKSEQYYSKLFEIYPDFELDYTTVTPKISDYFKDYHEIWLRTPGYKAKVYTIDLSKITYDAGINLKVEWHDPNLEIAYAILKYKQSGESKYSQLEKKDIKPKNHIVKFNLSFLNDPTINFNLEYYIELYDYNAKLITKIHNEKTPKIISVIVPGGTLTHYNESNKAWYSSTWFVTTVAVLVVGAIGGGAYYLLQDTKQGEPSEAELNIYITNGN